MRDVLTRAEQLRRDHHSVDRSLDDTMVLRRTAVHGLFVLAGEPEFDLDLHPFVIGDEVAQWCALALRAETVDIIRNDEPDELDHLPAALLVPDTDEVRSAHTDGRSYVRLRVDSGRHELTMVFTGARDADDFDPVIVDLLLDRLRSIGIRADHHESIAASSRTDPLTGLGNRAVADRAIARLSVGDGLIVLDLDDFKALNDTCGHAAGDRVLRELGRMLHDEVRASDVVARYGGDEIVVLLRAGGDLVALADRLVRDWALRRTGTTISAGLAVREPDEHPRSVFLRADDALYRAKRRGRDRLEVG